MLPTSPLICDLRSSQVGAEASFTILKGAAMITFGLKLQGEMA